jgi:FkbM family methyltransferase
MDLAEHKFQNSRNRSIIITLRNVAVTSLCAVVARPCLQSLWSLLSLGSRYFQGLGSGSTISRSGEQRVINLVGRAHSIPRLYFDVGGNMGHYTAALLDASTDAEIHVFEPSRSLASEIQAKFQSNGKVIVNQIALSDRQEQLMLVAVHEGATTSTFHKHLDDVYEHTEEVTCETLDKYCEDNDIREIGLLKVDVEGHELKVLRGASRLLSETAIHLIQFDGGAAVNSRVFFYDFWELLRGYGYEIYRVLPAGLTHVTTYKEQDECCMPTIYLASVTAIK